MRVSTEKAFVAVVAGRPAARAVATVNPDLHDRDGTPVGTIGSFAAEGEGAGLEVLAAAGEWLRGRGLRRVFGPMNGDLWRGYRFMTRGFDRPPLLGEPRNPATYPAIFERAGFRVRRLWNTFELDRDALSDLRARFDDAVLPSGYRTLAFADQPLGAAVDALHGALLASFSGFLGFTPISLADFRALVSGEAAVHPEASILVFDETAAVVGFTVVFRDPHSDTLLLHLGGITPEEARKKSGVVRASFREVLLRLRAHGATRVLATLVARGNPVRRLYGPYAADERREYALYAREL
jgi:hypothetical protein